MITMAMIGNIRRMQFRDGISISEIVKRASLACNTGKKWLPTAPGAEPKHQRRAVPHKLTPFVEMLVTQACTSSFSHPQICLTLRYFAPKLQIGICVDFAQTYRDKPLVVGD